MNLSEKKFLLIFINFYQKNINISDMEQLLRKIDNYLDVQEKKDVISASLDSNKELTDIIELVRKSNDIEKTLSFFTPEIREQIQILIEGGII